MTIDLNILDKKVIADLRRIGQQAEQLNYTAYLVGGVVRDILLKKSSLDLDIVVEGDAIELAKVIGSRSKASLTVHEKFGTATLNLNDGIIIDFVTSRSEDYPEPGALPVVKAGSIKEDLSRRDFTINALAVILNPDRFGQLQDFNGGLVDLKKGNIHILHDKSFVDDPTRILRAVRLESRLGFQIGKETIALLKMALRNRVVSTVKPPRYFAEFRKFFLEKSPMSGLMRLAALNGLNFIRSRFVLPLKVFLKVEKTILSLQKKTFFKNYNWSTVYLLTFFSQSSKEQIAQYAKDFHFTAKEIASLSGLVDMGSIIKKLKTASLKPSQIYEILDPLDLETIYFIRVATSVNIVASRIDNFLQKWRLVSLKITGEDLKRLGFKPGREMGALLHALLLKKIDGKIKTHADEMALAKRLGLHVGD